MSVKAINNRNGGRIESNARDQTSDMAMNIRMMTAKGWRMDMAANLGISFRCLLLPSIQVIERGENVPGYSHRFIFIYRSTWIRYSNYKKSSMK